MLPCIRAPTLVLSGADDRATPPALSRRLADGIPNARLEMVAACGHISPLEQPERVTEALIAFAQSGATLPEKDHALRA